MEKIEIAGEVTPEPTQVVPEGEVLHVDENVSAATISMDQPPAAPEDKPAEAAPETPVETPQEAPEVTPEVAAQKVTEAGLDMSKLAEEFNEKGALTEDTYKALADKGITKETVDAYIAGQQALAEAFTSDLANHVGGKAEMDALFGWAAETLSDAEKAAANKVLATGDAEAAKLVLSGLQTKYHAAVGKEGNLVNAAAAPQAPAAKPFKSLQEYARAMNHPLYKAGDKAYHAELDARMAVSNF